MVWDGWKRSIFAPQNLVFMIKNIVFDFGGVIADISRTRAIKAFENLGLKDADSWLDKYHQKGIFLEVEDGRIDAAEFCSKLGELCGREISFAEARQGWLGFMVDAPTYRLEFLEELRKDYKLYVLSNTNAFVMSWARSTEFTALGKPLDDYFDKLYLSYQVGVVKPHREIFEIMMKDAGLNPAETLFVDDGAANIETARQLGFATLMPINGEDWREDLKAALK